MSTPEEIAASIAASQKKYKEQRAAQEEEKKRRKLRKAIAHQNRLALNKKLKEGPEAKKYIAKCEQNKKVRQGLKWAKQTNASFYTMEIPPFTMTFCYNVEEFSENADYINITAGYAIKSPDDTDDPNIGMGLAAYRCMKAIAREEYVEMALIAILPCIVNTHKVICEAIGNKFIFNMLMHMPGIPRRLLNYAFGHEYKQARQWLQSQKNELLGKQNKVSASSE